MPLLPLMARSLADPLYERLRTSLPPTQSYTRADWEDEMPSPVAHFLNQLLKHHSRREARRLRRARTDWVNYEHPEMENAVRAFFKAVQSHTRVPADEWKDALRRATRHTTAHLVRPVRVLTDFVYAESEEPLRLDEILWRMDFFGPYAYLRKAVHAFAEKHDLKTLGPERFNRFLDRVDERITSDYDADRWLRLLDPLFAVARYATDTEQVPPALLQAFFVEKGRRPIENQLERYAADHDGVAPRTLHRLIERAGEEPVPSSPSRAPDEDEASHEEVWTGTPSPDAADPADPPNDDSVPLWKRFQQGRTGTSSADRNDSSSQNDTNQPLWARFQHDRNERLSDAVSDDDATAEPPSGTGGPSASSPSPTPSSSPNESTSPSPSSGTSSSPLATLEQQALGTSNPPHRSVYVRELFDGNQSDYQRVLRRLAEAESWGEASQIIASDVFRQHKVNIYSDAAVHFTNTIEDQFRNA